MALHIPKGDPELFADLPDHPMFRLDRSHVELFDSFEKAEDADRQYWLSRTPEERLLYMEYLRRLNYGRAATARLQGVLEIAEPGKGGVSRDWATKLLEQPDTLLQ